MYPSIANVQKIDPNFKPKEKIAEVECAKKQLQNKQSSEQPKPKIQRVPKHLRQRDLELHQYSMAATAPSTTHHGGGDIFHQELNDLPKQENKVATRYYTPKMISIGPIHHHLKLGEQHKFRWTTKYVEEMDVNTEQLYQNIRNDISGLKGLFAEDVIDGYGDDDYLSWMLFVDGCSLLYFMQHYDEQDPLKDLEVKYDQLIYMSRDLILLENQLPYHVLQLLSSEETGLREIILKFGTDSFYERKYYGKPNEDQTHGREKAHTALAMEPAKLPVHLLDLVRTQIVSMINDNPQRQQQREQEKRQQRKQAKAEPTYKNLRDLKAANIGVKTAKRGEGVKYERLFWVFGYLQIPKLRVDDTTALLILNVIAFEMCPDFQNGYDVSSFMAFLESIIDDAEDVRLLRNAGIIHNVFGSDEEVAQLFNSFSSDLVVEDKKYYDVKQEIEWHYSHTLRTWIAEFLHDHFRSPWTLAAFSAAVIALVLSGIQTYLTVFPKDNN